MFSNRQIVLIDWTKFYDTKKAIIKIISKFFLINLIKSRFLHTKQGVCSTNVKTVIPRLGISLAFKRK